MTTHYKGSDGKNHAIATMAYPHLKSAYLKLLKTNPVRREEIAAMHSEIEKRDREYAAQEAEKARG